MGFNANGGLTVGTIGLTGGNIEQFNFENLRNNGFFNFKINNTNVVQITPTALLIGTTNNPNSVALKVTGNIEITTTTATGVHTPTAQHLPIYVNNVLYYIQLLN
jgi:hypothetical protein